MTVIVLQSVAIATEKETMHRLILYYDESLILCLLFVRWHSPRYFLGKGSLCGHFWLNWRITIFLDFFFVVFFVACGWRAEIWDGYLLFKVYVILSILIHTQVLCNFIRVANPRVKSFMQHLNCVSQQQYVLSLHIESTELCDANNVPLFRYLSLYKRKQCDTSDFKLPTGLFRALFHNINCSFTLTRVKNHSVTGIVLFMD